MSFALTLFVAASASTLGLRADCLHDFNVDKGSTQNCVAISGLRYEAEETLSPELRGRLRLDPFAPLASFKADTPRREGLPTVRDTDFVLVDEYALIWSPRPNLEVAAESYGGAAKIPSVSGLAFANAFADTGWKQTALTVTYHLAAFSDMRVKLAAGNGEGENGRNLDPQQYFGFEADAAIVKGVRALVGASFDGNDVGSDAYDWLMARYVAECDYALPAPAEAPKLGYSMQRLAAGVMLDGTLKGAEGLKLGLGWQRSAASDLDKKRASRPSLAALKKCPTLDVDAVFVEDPAGDAVNTVQRTVYGVSVSYRLLSYLTFGADYTTRRLDTGSVDLFEGCLGFKDQKCEAASGEAENSLQQNAVTVGAGLDLADKLVLTIEYNQTDDDQALKQVFYTDQDGKTSDTQESFNARLAYNWK